MLRRTRWVKGTATLIGYRIIAQSSRRDAEPRAFVAARVVAQGDGIEPTAAELKLHTALDRLSLRLGRTFAVLIDPDDPSRVMPQDGGRDLRETIRARRTSPAPRAAEPARPAADSTDARGPIGGGVMPTAFGEP